MKTNFKTLLTLIAFFCSATCFAQDAKTQAISLIKEGAAFHDKGQYVQAIEKYDAALKIDPENINALYEKAFTLSASGKLAEAITLAEKVAATNKMPEAYAILGNIYDNKNDFIKAMSYYQQGITAFPQYPPLKLNLIISYMRQNKYVEAEKQAIDLIKQAPKYASAHRVYALATLGNNNLSASLLAWCSFLILEPNTKRSFDAMTAIKSILYNGIQKKADGSINMSLPASSPDAAKRLAIQIAVTGSVAGKQGLTAVDSLQLQLETVFKVFAEQNAKEVTPFHKKFMIDYFGALASSGNMPTFAHFITMTTNAAEDKVWLGAHNTEIKTFSDWATTTKRELE